MIEDLFRFGISNLKRRKLRSWLTLIGIFIGMASVVSLISLGQGLENSINEQFEKIGADKLIIQSKGIFGAPATEVVSLDERDLKIIENTNGVLDAAGYIIDSAKLEFNDVTRYSVLVGVDNEDALIKETFNYDIEEGRNLKSGEKFKVVLGNDFLKSELFNKRLKTRDTILLNDIEFTVVGFYETLGNRVDDRNVYVSYDIAEDLYDREDEYSFIFAKVAPGLDPDVVRERIEKEMREDRGLFKGNEDFTVQTAKDLFESFNNILNILQIFLIGIAGISLIVGGIGIMNTMYTAVLERRKEIGIMKSVGARNSDILLIFLIESGVLGFVGGLIGIIIGILFSKLVEFLAANAGYSIIKISFSPLLITGTLIFALTVGALSGLVPAYKASKLQPVEALRYE